MEGNWIPPPASAPSPRPFSCGVAAPPIWQKLLLGYTTRKEPGLLLSYNCRADGSLAPPSSLHNCTSLWASISPCVSLPICSAWDQNPALRFHAPLIVSWTSSAYWIQTAQYCPEKQAWIHMCACCHGPCFEMGPVSVKAGLQRVREGWGKGRGHQGSSLGTFRRQRLLGLSLITGRGGEWQGKGLLMGFSRGLWASSSPCLA